MIHKIIAILWLALSAGCATIDYDYPQEKSYFLASTEDTYLGREVLPDLKGQPGGYSGFYPMINGADAFTARLFLAQRAEKSIDLQYYVISNDSIGRALIHTLLQAADRGVRVRLLVDDMFTKGYDVGLAALYSHPNINIRVFNPFQRGPSGRNRSVLTEFQRINRRMHNKSFTVDNQVTIIGGRNIGDEYFGISESSNYGDLDVLGIGPIVQDVSNMFDRYWNHNISLPVPAFIKNSNDPQNALNELRLELMDSLGEIQDSLYAEAIRSKILRILENDNRYFYWAPYQFVADSPDKAFRDKHLKAESIVTPLIMTLLTAKKELLIVSPYFVPRKYAIDTLVDLQSRGIQVTIITNSLASNNQLVVHGGYAPSRKPLLAAGIKIYEVRPNASIRGTEFVDASGAKSTLHTKAFIVDDKEIFVGSFNFDPRSANINTELGVIIKDVSLTQLFSRLIEQDLQMKAYELFLNESGRVRWLGYSGGEQIIYKREPETSWSKRLAAWIARIVPKSQL